MPKLTGFELLEIIEDPPLVIFTTAYNEYAIKAFELNAVDYLLKPFSRSRFSDALERVQAKVAHQEHQPGKLKDIAASVSALEKTERIVVKTASRIQVIPVDTLWYLEAQDDYVMLYVESGKYLKQQTMKHYESALDSKVFVRIHRSYIVNLHKIASIDPYEKDAYRVVLINGTVLPVSKSGYALLKKELDF